MKVPLKSIDIVGEICDMFGYVKVTSVYHNSSSQSIQSTYRFCLDPTAVIDSLKVTIADREICGIVQEKSQAKATYTEAIKDNKRASLLEKNEDQYSLTIGNVQPDESIVITYTYLCKLVMKNNSYMFVYPTNVGERYGMFCSQPNYYDALDDEFDSNFNVQPETITFAETHTQAHTFYFKLTCKSNSGIRNIVSLTADIVQTIKSLNEVDVTALALPTSGDFNLFVETEVISCAYSSIVENGKQYFMLTHKVEDELAESNNSKEYLFVLDRSGSMDGQKIADAKTALKGSIELLEPSAYFNIISFGSTYSAMFDKSVSACAENKQKAIKILETYKANMNGTEIYDCLKECFSDKFTKFEFVSTNSTQVELGEKILVFLTDGQIVNLSKVFELVKSNSDVRIFSIGIGKDASRELVETLSTLTNGIGQMVIDSANITDVSKSMLVNTSKKYYKNISAIVNGDMVQHVGSRTIYPGQSICAFVLTDKSNQSDEIVDVSLTGYCGEEQKQWKLDLTNPVEMLPGLLQKLYANELIQSGTLTDAEIIKLSVEHNIMNKLTSFIMVDTVKCDEPSDDMTTAEISQSNSAVRNNLMSYVNCDPSYVLARSGAMACASACAMPGSCYRVEEVDALEGGLDMFCGGGSYTSCSYEILKHVCSDGSFLLSDQSRQLIMHHFHVPDVTKISISENADFGMLFNIMVLLHMKKMTGSNADNHVVNLEKWLDLNCAQWKTIQNRLSMYVISPIVTHGGGDY